MITLEYLFLFPEIKKEKELILFVCICDILEETLYRMN